MAPPRVRYFPESSAAKLYCRLLREFGGRVMAMSSRRSNSECGGDGGGRGGGAVVFITRRYRSPETTRPAASQP